MGARMYYDEDVDISVLDGKKVGIIGYGIQGRAQAQNLRDSGINIRIGNRQDNYIHSIIDDGFEVFAPEAVANWADIILFLIPDQAQVEVYEKWIKPYLASGKTLVFAHGYCLYFNTFDLPDNIDVLLLAPRMPGIYIRERFLTGWGVPVFIDVANDFTGNAFAVVLALAKCIGATRVGAMQISYREETEIDLFVEQYLLPVITKAIHQSFDFLLEMGFTPEAVISELYASSEIGKLITDSSKSNIYQVFRDNASPTCQFGKMMGIREIENHGWSGLMEKTLERIRSKVFDIALREESKKKYENLKNYDKTIDESQLVLTHNCYNSIHRNKKVDEK